VRGETELSRGVRQDGGMPGPPATFTPELGAELTRLLGQGQSVWRAAGELGVSPRTATCWLDQGLAQRPVEEPIRLPLELRDRLVSAEPGLAAVVLRAARSDWRAALAILERVAPERWRLPQLRVEQPSGPRSAAGVWAELDELAEKRREKEATGG
jgi:hypothetical protein